MECWNGAAGPGSLWDGKGLTTSHIVKALRSPFIEVVNGRSNLCQVERRLAWLNRRFHGLSNSLTTYMLDDNEPHRPLWNYPASQGAKTRVFGQFLLRYEINVL